MPKRDVRQQRGSQEKSLLRGISQVSEELEETEGKTDGSYPNNMNTKSKSQTDTMLFLS